MELIMWMADVGWAITVCMDKFSLLSSCVQHTQYNV